MLLAGTLVMAITCGGGGSGGGGTGNGGGRQPSFDPWKNIAKPIVPPTVTAATRVLEFSDGMSVSYISESPSSDATDDASSDASSDTPRLLCRAGEEYQVCLDLDHTSDSSDQISGIVELSGGDGTGDATGDATGDTTDDATDDTDVAEDTDVTDETGIYCYSKRYNLDNTFEFEREECEETFKRVGEKFKIENFSCKASTINGDNGLECSDNWAIVIHGKEGDKDGQTICRVHLSDNSGQCLGPQRDAELDKGEDEDATADDQLIQPVGKMQQSKWMGYGTDQLVFDATKDALEVVDAPEGARFHFDATPDTLCSVYNREEEDESGDTEQDESDDTEQNESGDNEPSGLLTAAEGPSYGVCEVDVTVSSEGYVDRTLYTKVKIAEANPATWEGYGEGPFYTDGNVIEAEAVGSEPAAAIKSFTVKNPDICTIEEDTGNITPVSEGVCTAMLKVTAEGFVDKTFTYQLDLKKKLKEITWGDFGDRTLKVGSIEGEAPEEATGDALGIDEGTVTYALKAGSELNCELVDEQSGRVIARPIDLSTPQTCTIIGTVVKENYHPITSEEITISLEAGDIIGLAWEGYDQNTFVYEEHIPILLHPSVTSPLPEAMTYTYETTAENTICEVDTESGELSVRGVGDCLIIVTARATGYNDESTDRTVTIEERELGEIAWGDFLETSRLKVGGESQKPVEATGDGIFTDGAAISYAIKSGLESNCEMVDASSGEVRAKVVDLGTPQNCIIIGTAEKQNYESKVSEEMSIALEAGDIVFSWDGYENGNSTSLGESPALVSPTATAPLSGVTYTYATSSTGICSVSNDGTLTTEGIGECLVVVTAVATGYNDQSNDVTVSIGQGTLGEITWGSFDGVLKIGSTGKAPSVPSGAGTTGATISYSLKSGSEAYCDLESPATGSVIADKVVDLSSTKSCVVTVKVSKTGFASKTRDISINLAPGDITGLSWNGYNDNTPTFGGTNPSLINPTTNLLLSSVGYSYGTTTASTICTVASNGAFTMKGPGECVVVVTARASGYNDQTSDVTVTIGEGTLGTITWGRFSGSLKIGNQTGQRPSTHSGGVAGMKVVYAITEATTANCELINEGTGQVRARNVENPVGKTCVIYGTATKAGYESVRSGDISINLALGDMVGFAWSGYSSHNVRMDQRVTLNAPSVTSPSTTTYTYSTTASSVCAVNTGNGDLTFTRPGSCPVKIVASAPGYGSRTITHTVVIGEGQQGQMNWGSFRGTLKVGNTTGKTPTGVSGAGVSDATVTYALKSGSESNCELGSASTGQVMAKQVDLSTSKTCTVIGTARRTHYVSKTSGDISIPLEAGDINLNWTGYASNRTYLGGSSPALVVPQVIPAVPGVSFTYATSADNRICSIDASGDLTVSGEGNCPVVVTARATGYRDASADVTVIIESAPLVGMGEITWGSFSGSLQVGAGAKAPSEATGDGIRDHSPDIIYALKAGSESYCTLEDASSGSVRAIAVENPGSRTCTIRGTATKEGYRDATGDISINLSPGVLGTIAWPTNIYNQDLKVGDLNGKGPGTAFGDGISRDGAVVTYEFTNERSKRFCRMKDSKTGRVVARLAGGIGNWNYCFFKGHARKLGYTTRSSTRYQLRVVPGDIVGLSWAGYSSLRVVLGQELSLRSPGVTKPTSGVSYSYSTTAASSVCTVNSSTGELTIKGLGDCPVTVTARATAYNDARITRTVSITALQLKEITWGSFDSTLKVGDPTGDAPSAATGRGVTEDGAAISYALQAGSEEYCELTDASTGHLVAKLIDVSTTTKTCTIRGTASKDGYDDVTSDISVTLEAASNWMKINWGGMNDRFPPYWTNTALNTWSNPTGTTPASGIHYSFAFPAPPRNGCTRIYGKFLRSVVSCACVIEVTASANNYLSQKHTYRLPSPTNQICN